MKGIRVSNRIGRREFLSVSSKAALLTAAGALIDSKVLLAATGADSGFNPLISIGYGPSVPDGRAVSLIDATDVLLPDPLFLSRGARVTILGAERSQRTKAPGALFLDVMYPAISGAANESHRFRFWSATGRDDLATVSARVSFRIPVLATSGIEFAARYRRPDASSTVSAALPAIEKESASFTLSLGGVPGPKLATGVYVVALREPGDSSSVSWSGLRMVRGADGVSIPGAAFSHVILQIAYGDDESAKPSGIRLIS